MKKKVSSKKIISSNVVPSYSAVFELDEKGFYNVSFPSFPGCVTFGKTFEEAKKMAEEALGLWIEERAILESKKQTAYKRIMKSLRESAQGKTKFLSRVEFNKEFGI